jgi:2-desacetyl-2-hydroxyethyl bacteriochlorophyllide A dehydrogenase
MNVPPTMQALQTRRCGELALTWLPTPRPGRRDVLIRTVAATICTSDLSDLLSNPFGIVFPRVFGHEAAGIVAACGDEVQGISPGTRVAVHPVVPCGECRECTRGMGHLCARMGHLGHDRDGAFATYFIQRADRVRRLPDEVPASLGALLEPVAVCLQAVARAGNVRERTVLVVGDGPFGNIIARLAVRAGAARVIVVGHHPSRLARIPSVETYLSIPDERVDVAILAVGSAQAVTDCVGALGRQGRLVVFSAVQQPTPIDLFAVHLRELEIVGSCNDEERLDEAMECLRDRALALEELITHEIPFERWAEAVTLARDGHDRALKVALTFPEAG